MNELATPLVLTVFVLAGLAIWWAGTILSPTTDAIDAHFGWGEGLGGAVFLAIATNLPEVAIVTVGALRHDLSLAVGNILGGIAIQTVVLVLLDGPGLRGRPLSSLVNTLTIALEGMTLIAILMVAIMGALLPGSLMFARLTPPELVIFILWLAGLWLISTQEDAAAWRLAREEVAEASKLVAPQRRPIGLVFALFAVASLVTLAAGVAIELAGTALADRFHMTGLVFGATVLAATTALPEVTTGLAAIRAGRYELALSDIIGGNAFLPVLFLLGTLISGDPILANAQRPDLYLTALGALLTAVYVVGVVMRSERLLFGAGIDSLVVLVLYIAGIAGLFFIR